MILPTDDGRSTSTRTRATRSATSPTTLLCEGQQQVAALGYSPLPINLVEAGFAAAAEDPRRQRADRDHRHHQPATTRRSPRTARTRSRTTTRSRRPATSRARPSARPAPAARRRARRSIPVPRATGRPVTARVARRTVLPGPTRMGRPPAAFLRATCPRGAPDDMQAAIRTVAPVARMERALWTPRMDSSRSTASQCPRRPTSAAGFVRR